MAVEIKISVRSARADNDRKRRAADRPVPPFRRSRNGTDRVFKGRVAQADQAERSPSRKKNGKRIVVRGAGRQVGKRDFVLCVVFVVEFHQLGDLDTDGVLKRRRQGGNQAAENGAGAADRDQTKSRLHQRGSNFGRRKLEDEA